MAISKIILNGVTQIDLTQDTVGANNLIAPNTAHGANGEPITGTATQGITPTGTKNISITENGTTTEDVTAYANAQITVKVPTPASTSMNVQIAQGVNRVNATSYTAVSGQTITVSTTGTYDIYWMGFRSSTSGTSGSQLYINGTAYGTAQTTFSNHGQSIKLTGVSLSQGDVLTVRAVSRGTQYYMYVGNLTIEQTA